MKTFKRIIAAVVMTAMLCVCLPAFAAVSPEYPEVPEGYDGYVTFAVSALTMGWTYIIDPVLIPVHEGESLAEMTTRAFDMLGWSYNSGTGEYGYYLSGIGCYEKEPCVPDYLMEQIEAYPAWAEENLGYNLGEWTGTYVDDEMLSEFEYCTLSGWMLLEDNVSIPSTADDVTVTIGSVYTWIFTIYGWGMDYGVSDGWGCFPAFNNPMEGVDRTEASRMIALIDADEELMELLTENEYEEVVDFIMAFYDPEATQEEIDSTLAALLEVLDTNEYESGDVNMDGVLDISDALSIMRAAMGIEKLSDRAMELADVNGDGSVNMTDALLVLRNTLA